MFGTSGDGYTNTMMETERNKMYTLKNLKMLQSGAYEASLYRDGKRIARVSDDGNGGQPRLWPLKEGVHLWKFHEEVAAGLTAWAATAVPEWYLTNFGQLPLLDGEADWELALGYLVALAEYERLSRKGQRTLLMSGGSLYTTTATAAQVRAEGKADFLWSDGDWVAA